MKTIANFYRLSTVSKACAGLCLLLCITDIYAQDFNPVSPMHTIPATDSYAGRFSNTDISLLLQNTGTGRQYTGGITFQGRTYPVQATLRNDVLEAYYQGADGVNHSFTLYRSGDALILESGGVRHTLHEYDDTALGAAQSTASIPVQTARTISNPYQMLEEYKHLSNRTGLALVHFMSGLRYWFSGAPAGSQTHMIVEDYLLPETVELGTRLRRISAILEQLPRDYALREEETALLRRFSELTRKGALFYDEWQRLLQHMLQLSAAKRDKELSVFAAANLPKAVQGSTAFTQDFIRSMRLTQHLSPLWKGPAASDSFIDPRRIMKWETLRNMSEVMRDGMDILRHMRK